MDTKAVQKQPQNALVWGWTVWGCVQIFYPSYISFSNHILFPKKNDGNPPLTLLLPRMPKIKIQDKSQISSL